MALNASSPASDAKMKGQLTSETKCLDGICRRKCVIPTSSCPSSQPIRCTDGNCVTLIEQCASPRCFSDKPYMCADGSCKSSMVECKFPLNIHIAELIYDVKNDNSTKSYVLKGQSSEYLATAFVTGRMGFSMEGVALSKVKNTKTQTSNEYDPVFLTLYSKKVAEVTPREFIRSAIIRINVEKTLEMTEEEAAKLMVEDKGMLAKDEQEKKEVKPTFVVDFETNAFETTTMYKNYATKNLFCLAVLKDGIWTCTSRKFNNINRNKFIHEITESGTYAVVFAPIIPAIDFAEDEFCGILCKNKRKVFCIIFFGLPTLLLIFYVIYKL